VKATLEVVILPVSDPDKSLDFYRDKLGFTLWRGRFHLGADPLRSDYASVAEFSDPDGNTWVLQERGNRND
jgi:hypothetical protein